MNSLQALITSREHGVPGVLRASWRPGQALHCLYRLVRDGMDLGLLGYGLCLRALVRVGKGQDAFLFE